MLAEPRKQKRYMFFLCHNRFYLYTLRNIWSIQPYQEWHWLPFHVAYILSRQQYLVLLALSYKIWSGMSMWRLTNRTRQHTEEFCPREHNFLTTEWNHIYQLIPRLPIWPSQPINPSFSYRRPWIPILASKPIRSHRVWKYLLSWVKRKELRRKCSLKTWT